MRRTRLAIWLALSSAFLALPLAAAADPPASEDDAQTNTDEARPRMNLAALQQAAEDTYPGLRGANARIRAARAQLNEAWVTPFFQHTLTLGVALAPELRGHPTFSPDSQFPIDNPWQPVLALNLEGAIPLWTFGKLPAARDAARAGVRAAESDHARVRGQLRQDIRRAYFALQLALDLRQMLNEGLPALRGALDGIREQLADGSTDVSEMDEWRLEAAIAETEAREADAIRLEAMARAALQILSGIRNFEIPDCPAVALQNELEPLRHYTARANSDRPEVRMLEAALRARQASVDVTEASFLPDIAIAYRFSTTYAPGITDQTNPFIIDAANYVNLSMALVARWSLDFWGNAYRLDRQNALLDDLRERTREANRGIELEVTEAYEAVRAARQRTESWGVGRRRTRSWFIASVQGHDVGTTESRDLVDAARAYFTARFSHLQAIHDLNAALASLERTSGVRVVTTWETECN